MIEVEELEKNEYFIPQFESANSHNKRYNNTNNNINNNNVIHSGKWAVDDMELFEEHNESKEEEQTPSSSFYSVDESSSLFLY